MVSHKSCCTGFVVVNLFWCYCYVTWGRKHFPKHYVALCVVTMEKALINIIYGTCCVIVLSWASGPLGFIRTVFINQVIRSKHCRISFLLVCMYLFFKVNPMPKLCHFTLDHCHTITGESLHHILSADNELTVLRIWSCVNITKCRYIELLHRIKDENLDVYLEWFGYDD